MQQLAEDAIGLAHDQGFARWLGSGLIRRGWALAEQGSFEEGLGQLREGLAIWQAHLGLSQFLALLAEAYKTAGQSEAGLRAVDEALAVVHRTDERHYEAELYRLKGELLLQRDVPRPGRPSPGTDACFQQAIAIARRTNAKSLELRAVMSVSRRGQGQRAEARDMLGEIYGWFTEGFATPDLREAKALLDELA